MYGVSQLSYHPHAANKLTSCSSNLQQCIYIHMLQVCPSPSHLHPFPLPPLTLHSQWICLRRCLLDYFRNLVSYRHAVWRGAPFGVHGRWSNDRGGLSPHLSLWKLSTVKYPNTSDALGSFICSSVGPSQASWHFLLRSLRRRSVSLSALCVVCS